jgi:hypothetical protein
MGLNMPGGYIAGLANGLKQSPSAWGPGGLD